MWLTTWFHLYLNPINACGFRFVPLLETVVHEIKPSIFHMIWLSRLKQQFENQFFITKMW